MKRKWTLMGAALVLAIGMTGMLSACGGGGEAQITDAASLAAANQSAQAAAESYHMDMDMNMELTLKMDGLQEVMDTESLTMPMTMKMSMDAGKETAHADSNTSMSLMGQSMDQDAEMYIDMANGVTYTKAKGSDGWEKTETDSSMSDMMNSVAEMSADLLAKAEYAETDSGYTLTLDAAEMGEALKETNLFGSYSEAGMEFKEFNINGGEIVYTFDKESALITKIEMKAVDVKAKGDMQGTAIDMQVPITTTIEYSQYGEIEPAAYEIPADVTGSK